MRKKFALLGLTALIGVAACLLVVGGNLVARGAAEDVLPRVVSVNPAPGAELAVTSPITVAFNTEMDHATTQAALTLKSADGKQSVKGTIAWSGNNLTFTPSTPLSTASDYVLAFQTGVKSAAGLPLQGDDSFHLRTISDLQVAQIIPGDGSKDIVANSVITVIFNHPVVPLLPVEQQNTLPNPIQIDPPVQGKGEWLNTSIYQFHPDPAFHGGTDYTITIKAGLTDQSGAKLTADVTSSFATIASQITDYNNLPSDNVPRDPTIKINFSDPMDHAATESAFSLVGAKGQKIAGDFTWSNDSASLTFKPKSLLDYSVKYTVKVDPNVAHAATGSNLLDKNTSYEFTIVPKPSLTDTTIHDGDTTQFTDLTFQFSTPMKLNDFMSHVTVSPKPPSLDGVGNDGDESYALQFAADNNSTFTVTLDPKGLTDIWGTPLTITPNTGAYRLTADGKLQIKFTLQFDYPADLSLQTGSDIGLYDAYAPQTRVYSTHRNVTQIDLQLWKITADELSGLLIRPQYSGIGGFAPSDTNLLRTWSVQVQNPDQAERYDLLTISANGPSTALPSASTCTGAPASRLHIGQAVVVLADDPRPVNVRAQATTKGNLVSQLPVGTSLKIINGPVCQDGFVWWQISATDPKTNKPVQGWVAEGDNQHYFIGPKPGTNAATAQPNAPSGTPGTGKEPLKPGAYFLSVSSAQTSGSPITHVMIVGTANVTLKMSETGAMAWVTDLKSGQPLANVSLAFSLAVNQSYDSPGTPQSLGTATTDANGIATIGYPRIGDMYNATVSALLNDGTNFAAGSTRFTEGIDPYNFNLNADYSPQPATVYLYSDRSLYKPGQPVYFRGIVRSQDDMQYTLLNRKSIPIEFFDENNQSIYKADVPLTSFGTFSGSFTLASDASLGYYRIVATLEPPDPNVYNSGLQFSREFSVAEYRTPEFQVNANADKPQVVQGDTVHVTVDSSFFFGGAVSNAKVDWTALSGDYYFNYTGAGYYDFYDYNEDSGPSAQSPSQYGVEVAHGTGATDSHGQFVIDLPATLGKSGQSQVYTIEADVTDETGQVVTGRVQVTVNAGLIYLGAGAEDWIGQSGQPSKIDLVSVDWNSQPVPNTNIDVKVVERQWNSVQEIDPTTGQATWTYNVKELPVDNGTGTVQTDSNGKGVFTFTPSHAGEYKIYATTQDSHGNKVVTSTFLYVAGSEYVPWRQTNDFSFTIKPDRPTYHVGDTASIFIASPFQGAATAWVTVERGKVLKSEVIPVNGSSVVYKLPIDSSFAPDAFVSVVLVKGTDDKNPVPAFKIGMAQLNVDSDQYKLNISVKPDKQQAGPRDTVTYALHVTDYQGKPAKAEVGVGLTDLAVLSLLPDTSTPIDQWFYDQQSLSVLTSSTLVDSVDLQTQTILNKVKGGGGGGPEGGIFQVRQLFVDTPLWEPNVTTDDNGDATVSVTLPDQLTTWRLDARAVTLPTGQNNTTLVGQQTFDLISTKPLLIRPVTPRFYMQGDKGTLAAVVNNNTGSDQQVTVKIAVDGLTLGAADTQQVTIASGGEARVDWPVTVQNVDKVGVTFYANTVDNKFTDAAKSAVGQGDDKTLPVYSYSAPETVGTAGQIGSDGGNLTEGLLLPPDLSSGGTLNVRFDPSLASAMIDALKVLKAYPYDCTEQTVSKFLPNILTYRALTALKVQNPSLKADLDYQLQIGLQKLYNWQHTDGGWGVFPTDESDSNVTAYALIGLVEAKQYGYSVDQSVIDNAVKYLKGTLTTLDIHSEFWQINRQAFVLYALAQANAGDVSRTVSIFDLRQRMDVFARALLAMTFHALTPKDTTHINALMSDLQNSAIVSASGEHWEESDNDYWDWETGNRATAIVLQALIEIQPTNAMIPNVVRWLMMARQEDAWATTQETAWSIMALTSWMQYTGELNPAYSFNALVNGQSIVPQTDVTHDTVQTPITTSVSLNNLSSGLNKLTIGRTSGSGYLYYTAHLNAFLPAEQVKALSRGVTVTRTYSLATDTTNAPITQAQVGQNVRVTLTIVAPSDLYYIVLNDPIPAGAEAINPDLATSSSVGTQPTINPQDPFYYGWGWWWFDNTQFRDQETVLSAPYLPAGTYVYTYVLRAGLAGSYHVPPASIQEQYLPEVFGRSDGALFTLQAANAGSDPTMPSATPPPSPTFAPTPKK